MKKKRVWRAVRNGAMKGYDDSVLWDLGHPCAGWRQARTHDVSSTQHKPDRALVHLHLGQHERIWGQATRWLVIGCRGKRHTHTLVTWGLARHGCNAILENDNCIFNMFFNKILLLLLKVKNNRYISQNCIRITNLCIILSLIYI